MPKPQAVLISDIHFSMPTLELAKASLNQAIDKANELKVPLIVAGDIHDTKANVRGECISAMRQCFKRCDIPPYVLIGNHDLINERSKEHSLKFLEDLVVLVDEPMNMPLTGCHGIPYYSDVEELRAYLKTLRKDAPYPPLIMHQGLNGSESGEYIQDRSALDKEDVKDFRVISGHYHSHQNIPCGRPRKGAIGLWTYIGNPYTLNFAEATGPTKGYVILMDNGLVEHVPTNLREHKVMDLTLEDLKGEAIFLGEDQDLVWVKIRGPSDELSKLTKSYIADMLDIKQSFRLDLIPTEEVTNIEAPAKALTQAETLNNLIDNIKNTDDTRKSRLKDLWQTLSKKD